VLCSMCHSNQMLPMLWTNSWQLSQHQSRFVDDAQILIHTYVGAWKIPNIDSRILSIRNWVLYKRSSDCENSFLTFIINLRKNKLKLTFFKLYFTQVESSSSTWVGHCWLETYKEMKRNYQL
jgi:hypothetical protein